MLCISFGDYLIPSVGTLWCQLIILIAIIWNIHNCNNVLYDQLTWCPSVRTLCGSTLYSKKIPPVTLNEESMVVFLQCNSECQIRFYNDKSEDKPIIEVYANNKDGSLLKFFEAIKEYGVNTDTKALC